MHPSLHCLELTLPVTVLAVCKVMRRLHLLAHGVCETVWGLSSCRRTLQACDLSRSFTLSNSTKEKSFQSASNARTYGSQVSNTYEGPDALSSSFKVQSRHGMTCRELSSFPGHDTATETQVKKSKCMGHWHRVPTVRAACVIVWHEREMASACLKCFDCDNMAEPMVTLQCGAMPYY